MNSFLRDVAVMMAAMLLLGVVAVVVVLGLAVTFLGGSSSGPDLTDPTPVGGAAQGPDVAVTRTPQAAVRTFTPVPATAVPPSPTRAASTPTPVPTRPAPTQSPTPLPTPEVQPGPELPPREAPAAPALADFTGRWRIVDTVTQGAGASVGQTFSFDVSLTQQGNRLTGGNSGITMTGTVEGRTAYVNYSQPALGYSGSFTWNLLAPNLAQGTFMSSYPNSGTSTLTALP